jgi:hypothetical protein
MSAPVFSRVLAAPKDWSIERKREYFEWSKKVIDQVKGDKFEALRGGLIGCIGKSLPLNACRKDFDK